MSKINTKKPVRFYDDRCKVEYYAVLKKILFENRKVCLCIVKFVPNHDEIHVETDTLVLFSKKKGKVLTENLMFWYAENFKR